MKNKKIIIMLIVFISLFLLNETVFAAFVSPKVSCGNITGIPVKIPEITSMIVSVIQIAIPIVLVIVGSIDLLKGMTAQKEDEIKKGQKTLIKRIIAAGIIFFVIAIVKFVISIVADSTNTANMSECIDCFINGVENCKE